MLEPPCPNPLWFGVPPIIGGRGECTPIPLGDLQLILLFLSVAVTLLLRLIPPTPVTPTRLKAVVSCLLDVLLDKDGDGDGMSLYCP